MTKEPQYTAVYLGKLKHYSRADQLSDCRKIVKMLKLPAIGRRVYEHDELDAFIHSLRGNECAMVATLEALAGDRGRGVSRRFYDNLERVKDKAFYLLDANTQLCSDDGNRWYEYKERVAGSLINGRELSTEKASLMAQSKESIVRRWLALKGTEKYMNAAMVWANVALKPESVAHKAMPYKELRETSPSNIRRIFDSRAKCGIWVNEQLKTKEK